ncbi:hypothetical protein IWQ47_003763 [Aquimarina sp. EL_43]|uniref:hypothetical protein n=1 Tax=unclassified Aquimarina TaxID=2627091 RepID=UPI0018C9191B|nr:MULTISPECIES: hypothetical protein [unclassified Aquimarina]MBG6132538.1 hypothetical protein [Aquimarina sp. EL_35]MBG6152669.1 hypothetical protein [Aquimarina sp. EL_32]MBG6170676.1 hypothetical protein [Aquimarina sp. EL_43]
MKSKFVKFLEFEIKKEQAKGVKGGSISTDQNQNTPIIIDNLSTSFRKDMAR